MFRFNVIARGPLNVAVLVPHCSCLTEVTVVMTLVLEVAVADELTCSETESTTVSSVLSGGFFTFRVFGVIDIHNYKVCTQL